MRLLRQLVPMFLGLTVLLFSTVYSYPASSPDMLPPRLHLEKIALALSKFYKFPLEMIGSLEGDPLSIKIWKAFTRKALVWGHSYKGVPENLKKGLKDMKIGISFGTMDTHTSQGGCGDNEDYSPVALPASQNVQPGEALSKLPQALNIPVR
ncbi:hypothetical protein J6590_003872 [Homalodisca vitripennis]|nr:hypothetical protein J6590_003872 [Homalodisca vitripennis]